MNELAEVLRAQLQRMLAGDIDSTTLMDLSRAAKHGARLLIVLEDAGHGDEEVVIEPPVPVTHLADGETVKCGMVAKYREGDSVTDQPDAVTCYPCRGVHEPDR